MPTKITPEEAKAREAEFRELGELSKRLSKSQDFRSLGDELGENDNLVVLAGVRAAQTKNPGSKETGVQ